MTKRGHAKSYVPVRWDPEQTAWMDATMAEYASERDLVESKSALLRMALDAAIRNADKWMPKHRK